jgi:hypothetical protein
MAENALTYFIALVVVCNVGVILGLLAIVFHVPRLTRRRPAHRADVSPLRVRVAAAPNRTTSPRRQHITARAA